MNKRLLAGATATAVGLLLAGCAATPEAITAVELRSHAEDQKARLGHAGDVDPVQGPIDLYEAMARALKHNMKHRVAVMETALAAGETELARHDLLPALTVRAGLDGRNNYTGSFSRPLLASDEAGPRGTTADTSQELTHATANLTLSWNVLDFGLSYIRARQAADKQLIAEENRRKAANRLIEQVRSAYWRAVSADRLRRQFRRLDGSANGALRRSRQQQRDGVVAPVTALTYQRELLDIKKQITKLTAGLAIAKAELAQLMGLKPGTHFHLKVPARFKALPNLGASLEEMSDIGLRNRPEVRELIYRHRINAKEANAALLELLPTAQLHIGANVDTNDLLFNGDWIDFGARTAWNAMRILRYPQKKRVIEAKAGVIREEALATSMMIVTQIRVARIRYGLLRRELKATNGYYRVQRQLLQQVRSQQAAGALGEQAVIRERMNLLVARVKRDIVYADYQNALAAVFWSMGIDPYDADLSTEQPLQVMADDLRSLWAHGRHPDRRDLRRGRQTASLSQASLLGRSGKGPRAKAVARVRR